MNDETYRFKLGDFECLSIVGGDHKYYPENFFANVPKEQIEEVLGQRNLPTDHIWTPYTSLYVNTGEHQVLVDMGASTNRMLQNIEAEGIKPTEIDTVIITHAHPDHVGGTLDDEGNPVYANAHYYMMKEEWDFWFSDAATSRAPERHVQLARQKLEPIRERMSLLDGESESVPGIRALPAPGHTPGHMVVMVTSGDKQLLYISDTVLYPLHLEHPEWIPIYDIMPEQAAVSKRTVFDRAAKEKILVLAMHFPPFPSLGHVVAKGKGWEWQPIETVR